MLSLGADLISECFQACVRSVAVSPPCPCVRSFGAGFGVGLGVAPAPLHVSLEMPALTVSRRLTLLGAGRLGGVGPPTTEQVQGSASERTWAGVQREEAEVAGGLLRRLAYVKPHSRQTICKYLLRGCSVAALCPRLQGRQ